MKLKLTYEEVKELLAEGYVSPLVHGLEYDYDLSDDERDEYAIYLEENMDKYDHLKWYEAVKLLYYDYFLPNAQQEFEELFSIELDNHQYKESFIYNELDNPFTIFDDEPIEGTVNYSYVDDHQIRLAA